MALALVMSAVAAWVVLTDGDTATPARRNPEQSWQSPGKTPGVSTDRTVMPVVVLPFAADADTGQKIADGITDDLINSLSRFTGLRVISRQTAFTYKGHPVDVAAVGAELGVRYVVEGSLRTEGSHLHVNAQLVDATNRVQVWSDRFDRNESHRFDVQDEIVKRLARALQVSLTLAEGQRKSERSAREPAVGELINAGWSIQYRGPTRDNLAQSRASFEEALRREPGLPVAMVGVASALTTAVLNAMADDAQHDLDRAELLLNSALQGDPTSYQAHYWKGLLSKARGRYELALPSLLRAIDLNPSASYAHAQVGHVLVRLGRVQEGMGHISYAMRLSPKDPALGWFHMFAGEAELELGRDEAARESVLRSIALMPKNPSTYGFLAAIYALRGDKTSAARYMAEFRKLSPAPAIDRMRDRLEAVAADPASYRTRLLQGLSLALAS
jgi:TolB-like protein/Flp pilus assembly protein TadD